MEESARQLTAYVRELLGSRVPLLENEFLA